MKHNTNTVKDQSNIQSRTSSALKIQNNTFQVPVVLPIQTSVQQDVIGKLKGLANMIS